jgi:hypothetical protein
MHYKCIAHAMRGLKIIHYLHVLIHWMHCHVLHCSGMADCTPRCARCTSLHSRVHCEVLSCTMLSLALYYSYHDALCCAFVHHIPRTVHTLMHTMVQLCTAALLQCMILCSVLCIKCSPYIENPELGPRMTLPFVQSKLWMRWQCEDPSSTPCNFFFLLCRNRFYL